MDRIKVTRRSRAHVSLPNEPGRGTGVHYSREINGTPYHFTLVVMPDGELRYFVSKYNGYLKDFDQAHGMRFACAWTQVHSIIVPPVKGSNSRN